jgi:PadR family transcriptional regulator, regulatory protein PadR
MTDETEIRISGQGLRVFRLFLDNVRLSRSGAEIARETGVSPGTLYPLLSRFEKAGLFASAWEEGDPHKLGRPRRRLYTITGAGIRCAQDALAHVQVGKEAMSWS